jgi:hypothetical protein
MPRRADRPLKFPTSHTTDSLGGDSRLGPILVALLHDRLSLCLQRPNDLDILLGAPLEEVFRVPVHCNTRTVSTCKKGQVNLRVTRTLRPAQSSTRSTSLYTLMPSLQPGVDPLSTDLQYYGRISTLP